MLQGTLLAQIAQYLDAVDIIRATATNSAFHCALTSPEAWQYSQLICNQHSAEKFYNYCDSYNPACFSQLRRIELPVWCNWTEAHAVFLSRLPVMLHIHSLQSVKFLTPSIAAKFPNLKFLKLHRAPVNKTLLKALS